MRAAADLTLPAGFVRALTAARSQGDVLEATAEWVPRIVSAERSSITVPFDEEWLRVHALGGHMALSPESRLSIEYSLAGQAFRRRCAQRSSDTRHEPGLDLHRLVDAGLYSAMVAPLMGGGECHGTVNIATSQIDAYDDEDELLLATMAELIGSFLATHALAEREAQRAATDPLTGLSNRSEILRLLDLGLRDPACPSSVLYVDLDGFKGVNDRLGHAGGDQMLQVFVDRAKRVIADQAAFGRLGGDEFLVVVADDPSGIVATQLAERLVEAVARPVIIGETKLQMAASVGIASAGTTPTTPARLLAEADLAMYHGKRSIRSITVAGDEVRAQAAASATIERDLDDALVRNELTFDYQPIRSLETGEILGCEALVRWPHPTLGSVDAATLIEHIESTGRTSAFTRWSLDRLCLQLIELRDALPWFADKAFGFNLTPNQLAQPDYVRHHMAALERHGLQPHDLVVEIVESEEILEEGQAHHTLLDLIEADVVVGLDDFGAGHHNLKYFTMFAVHAVKLDKSLLRRSIQTAPAWQLLKGIARLAEERAWRVSARASRVTKTSSDAGAQEFVKARVGCSVGRSRSPSSSTRIRRRRHRPDPKVDRPGADQLFRRTFAMQSRCKGALAGFLRIAVGCVVGRCEPSLAWK